MYNSEAEDWIIEIKENLPNFLEKMRDLTHPGAYNYSLSGDIIKTNHWGLGNTVFAAKIHYMLNIAKSKHYKEMSEYIQSFQNKDGTFFDPIIRKQSRINRIKNCIYSFDFNNLFYKQTLRAETRQSFAALLCLNYVPRYSFFDFPNDPIKIQQFVEKLDWKIPWGAASHVSHLAFFLNCPFSSSDHEAFKNYQESLDFLFQFCNEYRQSDGSWHYPGKKISNQQKINGAMKMITAYQAAGRDKIGLEKQLIDLCLSAVEEDCACDQFNLICVLNQCNRNTPYREEEIVEFVLDQLSKFREFYWPKYGGFSFYKGKANDMYYGAKISGGLPEPDIHGTVLFLWGIVLIGEILGIAKKHNLSRPFT